MTKIRFIRVSHTARYRPCRSANRQMDKKAGSLSYFTFHRDKTAMFLDYLMRYRQPQAAAFFLTAGIERIENMLEVFLRDTDTGIAHLDLDKLPDRRRTPACNLLGSRS